MPPKKVFHPRGLVIAVLEQDNVAAPPFFCEVEKIRISGYDREAVRPCVIPNGLVRGEPSEASVENVRRVREKFCETMKSWGEDWRQKEASTRYALPAGLQEA